MPSPPASPAKPENAETDAKSGWQTLVGLAVEALPAIAGAIGFVGFVALIGGAIQWTRFWAADLPADQAVHVIPRTELVTVGAVSTIVFTLLGLVALLLVYLLDSKGNVNARTRFGLLIVAGVELAAAVVIIELDWWQYLLFGVWAITVAVLAYRPLERLALRVERRGYSPGPEPVDDELIRREQAAFRAAFERFEDAQDAWTVAQQRERLPEEQTAAEQSWRRAQDAWERARLRWKRKQEGPRESPEIEIPRPRKPVPKLNWPQIVVRSAVVVVGLGVIAWFDETRWLLIVLTVPIGLFALLLAVARVTTRFAWYGVAVFLSVPLFGGVLAVADTLHTPKVQPIAVVRNGDDRALCGVYITQTSSRLYVGRVELDEGSDRTADDQTGRIFSIPMSKVDIVSVGPLQPIESAQRHALELTDEIYADRAEEAATAVKNPVTVVESKGEGSTTTTTTEKAAVPDRPTRRKPPPDHPPTSCAVVDLD